MSTILPKITIYGCLSRNAIYNLVHLFYTNIEYLNLQDLEAVSLAVHSKVWIVRDSYNLGLEDQFKINAKYWPTIKAPLQLVANKSLYNIRWMSHLFSDQTTASASDVVGHSMVGPSSDSPVLLLGRLLVGWGVRLVTFVVHWWVGCSIYAHVSGVILSIWYNMLLYIIRLLGGKSKYSDHVLACPTHFKICTKNCQIF